MLAGTSIFCFAASYAVALLLEITRLFFRSGIRGAILLGFGAAGFFAHTIFLVYQAGSEAVPLASEFDWYLVAAWLLAAVYLYLTLHFPRTAVGLFTLPLILVLVAVAAKFANQQPFPQTKASQFWGIIHGSFLLLGTVAVLVGFVAGLMHLVQSHRLKHKLPAAQGFQLPSLEWLERANSRATIFSALALAIGFISGLLLNLVNRSERPGESLPWNDPVIWSSGALLAWMTAAALFSTLYRPARQGRKVAYLTVASFLFLAAVLGYQLAAPTVHGAGTKGQGGKETRRQGDKKTRGPGEVYASSVVGTRKTRYRAAASMRLILFGHDGACPSSFYTNPNGADWPPLSPSPVGTAEFSRGRKPTEGDANDRRSRVAATEHIAWHLCRRYAACLAYRNQTVGLRPCSAFSLPPCLLVSLSHRLSLDPTPSPHVASTGGRV
jgi:ABC-type uncharacterized transport system permease subunit